MGTYLKLARRALETETPVMVQIQELIREAKDAISLAQGVVYWQPPERALEKVKEAVWQPAISRYGADEGIPELREALIKKLRCENNLHKSSVMVTAGANQAFVNLVLTLCDAGDSVVMFAPYYFNSYMSFQMTGVTDILVGPGNPKTLQPDADWLEKTLYEHKPVPKLVTVVNPGNPSGTYIPEPLLERISDLCKNSGSWLVVDNTYEYFMYDGLKHTCIEGDHIVNLFSFSKAYGMMGWRVGYNYSMIFSKCTATLLHFVVFWRFATTPAATTICILDSCLTVSCGNLQALVGKFQQSAKALSVETVTNEFKTGVEKPIQDSSHFNVTLEQFAKQMQDMMAQMISL